MVRGSPAWWRRPGSRPGRPGWSGCGLGIWWKPGGCARLWLRWEAIGPDGTLFPALDADLTLSPAGEDTTLLWLAGIYRLPERARAGLDPALARCFAAVTIRSFVARLACALVHPAGSAVPAGRPGRSSLCPGPDGRHNDWPCPRDEG